MRLRAVLALALIFAATAASAEVYRWVDAQGHKHYADHAPSDAKADTMTLDTYEPPAPAAPEPATVNRQQAPAPAAAPQAHAAADVVMYVMRGCGYCTRARNFFQSRGVAWREVDIDSSPGANAEFKRLGGRGTPLIFINGRRINGFNANALDAALRQGA